MSTPRPFSAPADLFYLPPPDVFLRILKNTKDKPVVSKLELKDLKSGSRKAVRGYIKIVVEYVKRTDSVYWTPKVTFGVKDIRHSKAQLVKLEKDRNTAVLSANKVITDVSNQPGFCQCVFSDTP